MLQTASPNGTLAASSAPTMVIESFTPMEEGPNFPDNLPKNLYKKIAFVSGLLI
jgi:hypothetical protein